MRHRKTGVKLNRTASHRNAMFKNMVTSLFKYDQIKTTDVKAKELRKWADNLITLAKKGDLHARRQAMSIMMEKDIVHKLFNEVGERFGKVNGGYTRITKLARRAGDAASISLIELISAKTDVSGKKDKKGKKETSKADTGVQSGIDEKPTSPDTLKPADMKTEDAGSGDEMESKAEAETIDLEKSPGSAVDDENAQKKMD